MFWLAFLLKVLPGDRCLSSLGFGCVMLLGFEYLVFQLQALILINSSVLCYCVLIGRAKHMGQSVNCCAFLRGALKARYFCICTAGVAFRLCLRGWGCPRGNCSKSLGIQRTSRRGRLNGCHLPSSFGKKWLRESRRRGTGSVSQQLSRCVSFGDGFLARLLLPLQ